jgi:hypothetical protein
MNQSVLKWLGIVLMLSLFPYLPIKAQTTPAPHIPAGLKAAADPIEFLRESKCLFKGKGYSSYSVGYIVRSYVSTGRINHLQWAKRLTGTSPHNWVVTLSYFDIKEGKKGRAQWSFGMGRKAVVPGDSGNQFLSSVPGEKLTPWPGANQMDVIE